MQNRRFLLRLFRQMGAPRLHCSCASSTCRQCGWASRCADPLLRRHAGSPCRPAHPAAAGRQSAPIHGVATRRLQRYLDWFCYVEQFKRGNMDRRELLFEHEAKGKQTRVSSFTRLRSACILWARCAIPWSLRAP